MKKGLLFISFVLISLLLVTTVSALEFDNIKFYDEETNTITIRDSLIFIPTTKVVEIELLSDINHKIIGEGDNAYAFELELNLYEDNYAGIISVMETYDFYDLDKLKDGSFNYKVYNPYGEIEVPQYSFCDGNETKCVSGLIATNTKYGTWENINLDSIDKGAMTIRAYWNEELESGERIEWIPTFAGVRIDEWADFEVGDIVANYSQDPPTDDLNNNGTWVQSFYLNDTYTIYGVKTYGGGAEGGCGSSGCGIGVTSFHIYEMAGADPNHFPTTELTGNYTVTDAVWLDTDWRTIYMPEITIGPGMYGLVMNGSSIVASTGVVWGTTRSNAYLQGNYSASTDWGATWQPYDDYNRDAGFEIYGILGTSPPSITIDYPTNTTYTTLITMMNYSVDNATDCWYSLNAGANSTAVPAGQNFTGLTADSGDNIWTVYCNDSTNKDGSSSVTFNLNLIIPNISMTYPQNTTYTIKPTEINYTYSANTEWCWSSVDGGATNSSPFTCTGNANVVDASEGSNTFMIAGNTSLGGTNQSYVTFSVDSIEPLLNITYPIIDFTAGLVTTNSTTIRLNWTVEDTNLANCWYYNNTENVTVTCGTNSTFTLPYGTYTHQVYANDTLLNLGQDSITTNYDFDVFQNSQTWNGSTYETSPEGFSLNISYNPSKFTSHQANLIYNTTSYTGTSTGTNGEIVFDRSISPLPATVVNTSFYWEVGLTNTSGVNWFNSSIKYQDVGQTLFSQCNASNTQKYLNLTFKDESSLARINSSIATSAWNYWLGSGSVYKSLTYVNTSVDEVEYDFCASPVDKTFKNNESIDYSFTGYPQRTVSFNADLTNTTTNRTLYLLASADGIYVTFTFTDDYGVIIVGADVKVERSFSGTFTHILDGATDDSGTATFWLDPDETYKLTFTSTGCTTKAYTVVPALNTYTVTTDCTGASDEDAIIATNYSSFVDGITWLKTPNNGIHRAASTEFTYYAYARNSNLIGAKFEIVDLDNVIINSSTAAIGTGCTSQICAINLSLYTLDDDAFKGKYYVQTTNSEGYILIEGDAYWRFIEYNTNATGTLNKFIVNFRNAFSEWSSDSACAYSLNVTCTADDNCKWVYPDNYIESLDTGTCVPNDERNRAEFSRILAFFLLFAIGYAALNKFTGIDNMSPGMIIWVLTGLIVVGTFAGGATGPGFFYYDGLFGHGSNAAEFLNNWILAMMMICLSFGYFAGKSRKES